MLGILLIFFIGKHFYKLSESFNQNKWLYAVLGVIAYYVGTAIGGVVLALLDELFAFGIDWDNNLSLGIIALPFGIGACYLFHYLLKKKWEKSVVLVKDEIEDIGKNTED